MKEDDYWERFFNLPKLLPVAASHNLLRIAIEILAIPNAGFAAVYHLLRLSQITWDCYIANDCCRNSPTVQ
jgi:hypothetical protein